MRLLSSLAPMLAILVVTGCPKQVAPDGTDARWRTVDAGPTANQRGVDLELQERLRREKAARDVERMRAVFVVDGERACKKDDDCTVAPFHCCGCERGGKLVGVARTQVPMIAQRRAALCRDYACPQMVSTDPTCSATKAKCAGGLCVVDVPADAATPGIDVAPIPDEDKPATP